MRKSFYVDDVLKSVSSRDDVMLIINEASQLLQNRGFCLTKFVINDSDLLKDIPEDKRAKEVKNIMPEMSGSALGIKWDIVSDSFYFEMQTIENIVITRRKILSIVSSLYDPLGFAGPLWVQGKLIFQEATRLKLEWVRRYQKASGLSDKSG